MTHRKKLFSYFKKEYPILRIVFLKQCLFSWRQVRFCLKQIYLEKILEFTKTSDDDDDFSQELNEGMCIFLLLYCHYLCVCVLTLSLPNVTFGVFI